MIAFRRVVMLGDIFAVPTDDTGGVAPLFSASGQDIAPHFVFFKVTKLLPESNTSLMIDIAKTRVTTEVSSSLQET